MPPSSSSSSPLVLFLGHEFQSASTNVSNLLRKMYPAINVEVARRGDVSRLRHATVVVPLMTAIPDKDLVMASTGKLKLIQQWGVGLEGVNVALATQNKVLVSNTPESPRTARSVAELAVHLITSLSRKTFDMSCTVWGGPRGKDVGGMRIAIVGSKGKIGGALKDILVHGYQASVLGLDDKNMIIADQIRRITGPPLDCIVLTAPLNPQTINLIDSRALAAFTEMGADNPILVNVGRGPLIDRHALEAALNAGLGGFGTDVWWQEPPPDMNHDTLLTHPKVVWTSHVGGVTSTAGAHRDELCASQILDFILHGKTPQFVVNAPATSPPPNSLLHVIDPPTLSRPSPMITSQVVQRIQSLNIPFSQRPADLLLHGKDESLHEPVVPDVVVIPTSTNQVCDIVKICAEFRYPITPFGRGTSLEGGVAALGGGLSLDTSGLTDISIDARNFTARVGAGVSRLTLNAALKGTGLMFPVDPGADASLGGMASTRASGTTAVKYGTMKQLVAGLTVVLPNGEVITTGGTVIKSSAGYDLTSLFVGSEGTLGVITQVLVRLVPIPEHTSVCVAVFPTLDAAVNTVIELKSAAVDITRAELLDALTMKAIRLSGLDHVKNDKPTLFLEFGGSMKLVEENASLVQSIAHEHGVLSFDRSSDPSRNMELWKARHHAYYASLKLHPPGSRGWPTDVCVPLSSLSSVIQETAMDVEKEGILAPIFGHVGDGNFHVILVSRPDQGREGLEKLMAINQRVVSRALAVGGTCTGEHGVGYGKRAWLEKEHGVAGVGVMRGMKRVLDPLGLMNVGKVFV